MPHSLIVGRSGTGKSSLAKRLAEHRAKRPPAKFCQIALDPLGSPWPAGVHVVSTFEALNIELQIMHDEGEVGCIYIDEANQTFSHSEKEHIWLMLIGRHFGLDITLITQYPKLLNPAARGQCERVHVFQIGKSAARDLAEDYAPGLDQATHLKRGEWLCAEWDLLGDRIVNRYKLFDP